MSNLLSRRLLPRPVPQNHSHHHCCRSSCASSSYAPFRDLIWLYASCPFYVWCPVPVHNHHRHPIRSIIPHEPHYTNASWFIVRSYGEQYKPFPDSQQFWLDFRPNRLNHLRRGLRRHFFDHHLRLQIMEKRHDIRGFQNFPNFSFRMNNFSLIIFAALNPQRN